MNQLATVFDHISIEGRKFMYKKQHFLLLLFAVVLPVLLTRTALAQEPTEQLTQIEYLEPIRIELRASPDVTVSKTINVPVKFTEVDGTVRYDYRQVAFELSNTRIEPDAQDEARSLSLPGSGVSSTITYLRCSGVLNESSRAYTSFVDWHYDGSNAWHDVNGNLNHSASSPWIKNGTYEYANYARGPSSSIYTWNTGYFRNPSAGPSADEASHQVSWFLEGNGDCVANGYIDLY